MGNYTIQTWFPVSWAEMHWPSKANVSSARLSFILKRFSSHLCIGQNGFHVRIKFSMSNLTLELSLCFLSYRSRKSGCLCIPSCRSFFFLFGHECVYLCVRPQFKVIFDHKLNGCTENGILLSMGVWLINNVALDRLCALYKPTLLPFSIWISLSL